MATVRKCPNCNTSNPDNGEFLAKCSNYDVCGYCRHQTLTGNVCDDCGAVNPTPVVVSRSEIQSE